MREEGALHLVSADIRLWLAARTLIVPMCTGDFWVNINNSELFVEQKWSYLNVERGSHSGNFVFTLPEAK